MARTTHAPAAATAIDIDAYMLELGRNARAASRTIAAAGTGAKSRALQAIAAALNDARRAARRAPIELDLAAAKAAKIDQPLIDRLVLDERGIDRMIDGIREVDALPDPIGAITDLEFRPSGIQVGRMRVPLGVIGIIYESRPNVTADAAALCLKSGNACILRGGSEAFHTNTAIAAAIANGSDRRAAAGDGGAAGRNDRSRRGRRAAEAEAVHRRAGAARRQESDRTRQRRVDDSGHQTSRRRLPRLHRRRRRSGRWRLRSRSTRRPKSTRCATRWRRCSSRNRSRRACCRRCVHQFERAGVELRGCAKTRVLLPGIGAATEADWYAEYLAPILSIRIVADSTKRSTTSRRMARSTPTSSSPTTMQGRDASSPKSIPHR